MIDSHGNSPCSSSRRSIMPLHEPIRFDQTKQEQAMHCAALQLISNYVTKKSRNNDYFTLIEYDTKLAMHLIGCVAH